MYRLARPASWPPSGARVRETGPQGHRPRQEGLRHHRPAAGAPGRAPDATRTSATTAPSPSRSPSPATSTRSRPAALFERRRTELLGRRDDLRRRSGKPARRLPPIAPGARRRPPRPRPRLARPPDRRRAHPASSPRRKCNDPESASPSPAWATAPARSCRASTTTGTPIRPTRCRASCTSSSAAYHVRDIELVAAFDVDATKVGLDVGKALFAGINNTIKFAEVPHLGVTVQRGPTLDGFGEFYREVAEETPAEPVDVAAGPPRHQGRRARVLPPGRLRGRAALLRPGLPRRRRRASSTPSRCSSPRTPSGPRSSGRPACRSSATTSRARSAPRSSTAPWPASSRTAAPRSTTRTS